MRVAAERGPKRVLRVQTWNADVVTLFVQLPNFQLLHSLGSVFWTDMAFTGGV